MRRQRDKTHEAASLPRTDRRIQEHENDTYGLRGKLPDPTVCTACGAMFRDGRWTWGSAPADAHRTECPACRRVAEDYPAGLVTLEGEFVTSHGEELRGLARNVEEREKQEHPLKRIMRIRALEMGGLEIATTDARLARAIGDAVHRAYEGDLDYRFTEAENLFRVSWKR